MSNTSLSDTLHRLMHAYKRQIQTGIQQQQISLPITQIRVLKGISRLPDCTARLIAQRMKKDKAQITRVLNGLMEAGFIEKTDNPKDQRSQLLAPTQAGKQILLKIDAIEGQAAAHMTRNLSAGDLKEFCRISDAMTGNSAVSHTTKQGATSNG